MNVQRMAQMIPVIDRLKEMSEATLQQVSKGFGSYDESALRSLIDDEGVVTGVRDAAREGIEIAQHRKKALEPLGPEPSIPSRRTRSYDYDDDYEYEEAQQRKNAREISQATAKRDAHRGKVREIDTEFEPRMTELHDQAVEAAKAPHLELLRAFVLESENKGSSAAGGVAPSQS